MSKLFAKLLDNGPQRAPVCATTSGYAYRCTYTTSCSGGSQNTTQKALKDPNGNICGPWIFVNCGCFI